MKPVAWLLFLAFLVAPAISRADGPTEKLMLAVLEFNNDAKLSNFEAETLADDVRAAVLDAVGSSFRIMTRESMMAMLPPGTDLAKCSEGQCEVEAGRQVGADRVVAGSVGRFEKDLVVRLKLFDTRSADLLAQRSCSGPTLTVLREKMQADEIAAHLFHAAHIQRHLFAGEGEALIFPRSQPGQAVQLNLLSVQKEIRTADFSVAKAGAAAIFIDRRPTLELRHQSIEIGTLGRPKRRIFQLERDLRFT